MRSPAVAGVFGFERSRSASLGHSGADAGPGSRAGETPARGIARRAAPTTSKALRADEVGSSSERPWIAQAGSRS